jgi:hypothetical protein
LEEQNDMHSASRKVYVAEVCGRSSSGNFFGMDLDEEGII